MIWLKKIKKNLLWNDKLNISTYLLDMMEPFETYLINLKEKDLNQELLQEGQFHLYQLMEIYVDTKICSIWVTLDEKNKYKFALYNFFNFLI